MTDETTLVACAECGREWPSRYLVAGMCGECATKHIEMFNRWLMRMVADLAAILAGVKDPVGVVEETVTVPSP